MAKIHIERDKESVNTKINGSGVEILSLYAELTGALVAVLPEKVIKVACEAGIEEGKKNAK